MISPSDIGQTTFSQTLHDLKPGNELPKRFACARNFFSCN